MVKNYKYKKNLKFTYVLPYLHKILTFRNDMKRVFFVVALGVALAATVATGCKKDEGYVMSEEEKAIEAQYLEMTEGSGAGLIGTESEACFTKNGSRYGLKVHFKYTPSMSSQPLDEGYFDVPYENVAPESRAFPRRYYLWAPGDRGDILFKYLYDNVEQNVKRAILFNNPGDGPRHFIAIELENGDIRHFAITPEKEGFPAEVLLLEGNYNFTQNETKMSAVYHHKPISDKNVDILSITFDSGDAPHYNVTLNFVLNPATSVSVDNIRGRYYGSDNGEYFSDKHVFGSWLSWGGHYFTVKNEWGETVSMGFPVPSSSNYINLGYNSSSGILDAAGVVDMQVYLLSSEGKVKLSILSPGMLFSDITED